jgi:hypothetical protein
MHYIARLLAHPRRPFHVAALAANPSSLDPPPDLQHISGNLLEAVDDGAMRVTGRFTTDPKLDLLAMVNLRARQKELRDELRRAKRSLHAVTVERLKHELASISELLKRDTNADGQSRAFADETERARKNVLNAIDRSIGRIAAAHTELGAHLRDAIDTGTFCVYRPARHFDWHIAA